MDTGSLYRLVALSMSNKGQAATDETAALAAAKDLTTSYKAEDSDNPAIRTDEISQMTSKVSAIPAVRAQIIDLQRNFYKNPPALANGAPARGAILDGRDIGTVICPDADVKFFVTAAVEARALRRFKELQNRGFSGTYDAVLEEMRERDARDSGRAIAPMKPAADAIILDTTDMSVEQVLAQALSFIRQRLR